MGWIEKGIVYGFAHMMGWDVGMVALFLCVRHSQCRSVSTTHSTEYFFWLGNWVLCTLTIRLDYV